MNCSSRVSSSFTGRPVLSAASARMSSTNISCLPPKPPPTRSQNTRTLSGARPKRSASARRVRNGTWVLERMLRTPVGIDPGEPAMGFERRVLDALGGEGALIGDGGLRQRGRDVAIFTMLFGDDVAPRIGDAVFRRLVAVNDRCARCDRQRRIEHRRQDLVVDLEAAAALFGGGFGLRDDSGDLLPDEADDVVEHAGVVGVHPVPSRAARSRTGGPARPHASAPHARREP